MLGVGGSPEVSESEWKVGGDGPSSFLYASLFRIMITRVPNALDFFAKESDLD